ncbi:MAG: carbohydrate-binding domain-containing protein [Clostridia bacterium]|nr:carbohydrate-binding domain-containing protein [Clostridia bacterium]
MKQKSIIFIAIILILAIALAACGTVTSTLQSDNATNENSANVTTTESGDGASSSENGASGETTGTPVSLTLSEESAADYLEEASITLTEAQTNVSTEGATMIDLSALTEDNAPKNTTFKKNVLTINAAGTYVLSGTLNGAVSVAKNVEGTVRIVLSGATIHTTEEQDVAAIVFKEASDERILTIADDTVNEISDSIGDKDTEEKEADSAALKAKKCSLTINGQGTLKVLAVGETANGISVKNALTVIGTTLEVTAVKNGIKAGNLISLHEANITVTAGNDGIKTDVEPETEEEAEAAAADKTAGYIYIEKSSVTVTAGDDGIAANNCLYIANEEANVITVKTNGGAPEKATSSTSEDADGKALKAAGIVLGEDENETKYAATFEENYAIVITGGTFLLDANDDAIHSAGNLIISGGIFTIASGDDGIKAEYLTKITGGDVTVTKAYEGIEGALVEISGGNITINATEDGVNAANGDLEKYDFNLYITGGVLTVNCNGDGLDSNGKLVIAGGTVTVFGPTNGGNSALDSVSGTTIQGGTVIATCCEAMDPVGATQYMINANLRISANTLVTLSDASGNVILSFTQPKACNNVVISTPTLTSGTYTLSYGTASTSVTAVTGQSGGRGGMGGMGGQMNGDPGGRRFGESGDDAVETLPDGEFAPSDRMPPMGQEGAENAEMPELPEGNEGFPAPPTSGFAPTGRGGRR